MNNYVFTGVMAVTTMLGITYLTVKAMNLIHEDNETKVLLSQYETANKLHNYIHEVDNQIINELQRRLDELEDKK